MSDSLQKQLAQKEREITAVITISQIISQDIPLPAMLDHVSAEIASLLNAPFCAILIRDHLTDTLHITGSFGLSADYVAVINRQSAQYRWITGLPSDRALAASQPIVWEDARVAPEFAGFQDAVQRQGYITMVAAPLSVRDKHIGTINCYYTSRYTFSTAELSLLSTLANHTATVIRNKQLLDALNHSVSELSLLNQQLDTQRELLLQSEAIHKQLTRLVLEEEGLTAVVSTTADLLSRPVALYDARLQLIAASPNHPNRSLDLKLLPKLQRHQHHSPPRTPISLQVDDQPLLLTPLVARQRTLGYFGVVETPALAAELEQRALEHAATVCTLELVKQRVTLDTDRRMRGDFIDDMLLGRFTDASELKRRAAYFKFTFEGTLRVLVVDINSFGRYIEQHHLSEAQVEEIKHTLANMIEQCCRELKKATFVAPQGDRAVVLWPMRNPQTFTRIEKFATLLRKRMMALWPQLTITVGVSTPITNPLRFSDAHRECLDALAIVKRFGQTVPIITFDDLGIYALLLRSSAVDDLQTFAQRLLEPVLTHDRADDLLNTLSIALRLQFSPQKSAEALFVHPNTVKYRLRQLRELLNVDLNNTQQMLEVQLALLIYSLTPVEKLSSKDKQ